MSTAPRLSHYEYLPETEANEWMPLFIDQTYYVFHVPSSSLVRTTKDVWEHLKGRNVQPVIEQQLELLRQNLPAPIERKIEAPSIKVIALNVAQSCNLRCKYCFAGEGDYGQSSMMSKEMSQKAVDFFAAQTDSLRILFFGGEPLLNFHLIKEVVEYSKTIKHCTFQFAITTNATLLSPEKLAYMNEHQFKITVSYDGHGLQAAQRLNKDKVSNSEALVERKLKLLQEQLLEVKDLILRGTVMPNNLHLMEEAVAMTLSSLPHAFGLTIATARGNFEHASTLIEEGATVLERVVDRILETKDFGKLRRLVFLWDQIVSIRDRKRGQKTCGAGISYVSVATDGSLYLCHRFTEDKRGKVGDLDHGLDNTKLADYGRHRLAQHDPCRRCWMREICAGGCFHENLSGNNTQFIANPTFCKNQHKLRLLAVKVYARLLREAPHVLLPVKAPK
jgi:uncharacterized protein